MRVTILNLTEQILSCSYAGQSNAHTNPIIPLLPSVATPAEFSTPRTKVSLHPTDTDTLSDIELKGWKINPEGLLIQLSLTLGALWKVIPVPDGCPWRIYLTRVRDSYLSLTEMLTSPQITRRHHKLLIFPQRSLCSFLSEMPDKSPLSSLCLPGNYTSWFNCVLSISSFTHIYLGTHDTYVCPQVASGNIFLRQRSQHGLLWLAYITMPTTHYLSRNSTPIRNPRSRYPAGNNQWTIDCIPWNIPATHAFPRYSIYYSHIPHNSINIWGNSCYVH